MLWTAEQDARLKQLTEVEKLSARDTANALGVTRNSVIGRRHRLKLESTFPKSGPKPRRYRIKPSRFMLDFRSKNWKPLDIVNGEEVQRSEPVQFTERRDRQCPFPLWTEDVPLSQKMVCGAPKASKCNWCEFHLTKVYAQNARAEAKVSV